MDLFQPRYKIDVAEAFGGGYRFYIWKGLSIVDSGYGFHSATKAAEAGVAAKNDLLNAWRITHGRNSV